MSVGLVMKTEPRGLPRVHRALCGALSYLALWGGFCGMAYLSTLGLLPLAFGGVFTLALTLAPEKRRVFPVLLGGGLFIAAALLLLRREVFFDGVKYFLNRLFAASEERQAYEYARFTLTSPDALSALRYALVPLGMLSGFVCGLAARYLFKWLFALIFALFCAAAAYLGVSPGTGWTVLLAAPVLLPFLAPSGGGAAGAALTMLTGLLPAVIVCAVVFFAFPGEDTRLSAWDEAARDYLAFETVAYTDQTRYDAARRDMHPAGDTKRFYQEEETAADTGGEDESLSVPYGVLLAILLTALVLFAPAVWSDRLKKRRARARAGLDDPDPGAAVRAAFLYAMRWLDFGGVALDNRPYGEYAGAVGELFSPALRSEFEEILPLWREAAYSRHEIDEAKRAKMLVFAENARRAVWDCLGTRERLRIRYVEAL